MSTPPITDATELGVTAKIFNRTVSGRPMRDLTDMGEVWKLADEIADGGMRRVSLLSVDEQRAIASLAAQSAFVLHYAILLVEASDSGMPKAEIKTRLEALCTSARSLLKKGN